MKKILTISLVTLLLLTGCSKNSVMQASYDKYMESLMAANDNSEYIPCNIEITYDRITPDQVEYQIVIDEPKENMRNINAVVTHDKETTDGYPSIGVFDEEPINLNIIPTEEESSKGIVLVGYFKYDGELEEMHVTFKIGISYVNDAIEEKEIYYIKSI